MATWIGKLRSNIIRHIRAQQRHSPEQQQLFLRVGHTPSYIGLICVFNFRGLPVNRENCKNWTPRKFPAIRYRHCMQGVGYIEQLQHRMHLHGTPHYRDSVLTLGAGMQASSVFHLEGALGFSRDQFPPPPPPLKY